MCGKNDLGPGSCSMPSGNQPLPAASAAPRAAGEDTASNILLWNTRCVSEKGEVDFGRKKDWERVSPAQRAPALPADLVVENARLAVIFCRHSAGPLICPKSAVAQENDRSRLVPVAPSGEPARHGQRDRGAKER